jgi:hypothetical protein
MPIILIELAFIQTFDLWVSGVVAAIIAWVHIGVRRSGMRSQRWPWRESETGP